MSGPFLKANNRAQTASLKWTKYPSDVMPVWLADMDFEAPEAILDVLRAKLDHGVLGYELPQQTLYKTVASRMQHLYGWDVEPDAVVATPGIIVAFNAAAWALCQPGQGILTQPPIYPPFLKVAGHVGLVNQCAELVCHESGGTVTYAIDWDQFRSAIHSQNARTGMFLLCNPHNPTGQAYGRADLLHMADLCLEHGVPIVSDEIHSELLLEDTKHIPLATLSREIEQQTITLIAPSKTYNVPGLFCGFAIIPNAVLREKFRMVLDRFIYQVSNLSLLAGETAYSGACDPWLQTLRAQLTANRDWITQTLRKKFPKICSTIPQATYLAWLDCRSLDLGGAIPYSFFLDKARVAFNQGDEFGPGGEGFVRLNFGTTPQVLQEVMERMDAALA